MGMKTHLAPESLDSLSAIQNFLSVSPQVIFASKQGFLKHENVENIWLKAIMNHDSWSFVISLVAHRKMKT